MGHVLNSNSFLLIDYMGLLFTLPILSLRTKQNRIFVSHFDSLRQDLVASNQNSSQNKAGLRKCYTFLPKEKISHDGMYIHESMAISWSCLGIIRVSFIVFCSVHVVNCCIYQVIYQD